MLDLRPTLDVIGLAVPVDLRAGKGLEVMRFANRDTVLCDLYRTGRDLMAGTRSTSRQVCLLSVPVDDGAEPLCADGEGDDREDEEGDGHELYLRLPLIKST